MKKLITAVVILTAILTGPAIAQTTWNIDKSHSKVQFSTTHMLISEVMGKFKIYDGKIESKGEDFADAKIEFTVDVNSIDTEEEKRDQHLKSDDFFNAEKYPKMIFKSKSFKKVGDKKYKLVGDLTIRDVTKEVQLDVTHNGTVKSPWGSTVAGFKVTGSINRFDYGLKWNTALEAGGLVVGETVNIICDIELIKQ